MHKLGDRLYWYTAIRTKVSIILIITFMLCLATSGSVLANGLIPYAYRERVAQADVVLVGKVEGMTEKKSSVRLDAYATTLVVQTLKGQSDKHVKIYTRSEVVDLDTLCCEVGRTYLFFLSRRSGGRFAVVDGHFGAIPLD